MGGCGVIKPPQTAPFSNRVGGGFSRQHIGMLIILVLLSLLVIGLYCPLLPRTLTSPKWSHALFASNGELLDVQIASDHQWRLPAPAVLPQKYATAVLAFEDRYFYTHPGINPVSIARAFWANLRAGRVVSGASTISQQVARLALQNPPRTYINKLHELLLALQLEVRFSKAEILALYATHAPFGGNVIGLQAASWRYFSRVPDELSWAEAALLAVLPNSPAMLHPGRNRDALLRKRNRLLNVLHERGDLSDHDYQLALLETLPQQEPAWPALTPHLLQRRVAEEPGSALHRTTIDAQFQRDVLALAKRHGRVLAQEGVHNQAIVVIDHQQMTAKAYVGNVATASVADTDQSVPDQHGTDVDIARAPRSTGSVLKPLLYGVMVQEGELLPTQLVPDIPTTFGSYSPQNYDRDYRGAVPAREALAQSLNVPAVRLLARYGVDRFRERLRAFGFAHMNRSAEDYGLSLILGGAEASLWELSSVYANLTRIAAGNEINAQGADVQLGAREILHAKKSAAFPLSAGTAWLTLQVMTNVVRPGADSYWRDFEGSQVIAWKTGTSYGLRDGWAIGSNGQYTVGVWTGNADGSPAATLGGAHSAGPILMDVFALLGNSQWLGKPLYALKKIRVCSDDGYLATTTCDSIEIQVPVNADYTRTSPNHTQIFLARDGQWRVHSGCEAPHNMTVENWFVLPPAQEYFWKKQHAEYRTLPPWRRDCIKTLQQYTGEQAFALIYPDSENTLHLPLGLDGKLSNAVFRAVHRDPNAILHWHIDDEYLGDTTLFHEKAIRAAPGQHALVLVDNNGQKLERHFSVIDLQAKGK
jgi:penicillin-binding protein 1C